MSPSSHRLDLAVTKALKDTTFLTRDTAAVALARRYARLIEDAATVAADLSKIIPENDRQADMIRRLAAKVNAQNVASDLGPKLLAALAALGMTPQSRASVTKGGTPDASPANPAADVLTELQRRAAAR